jgi:hypothetical protein
MSRVLLVAKKRADITEDQFITYWVTVIPGCRRRPLQFIASIQEVK